MVPANGTLGSMADCECKAVLVNCRKYEETRQTGDYGQRAAETSKFIVSGLSVKIPWFDIVVLRQCAIMKIDTEEFKMTEMNFVFVSFAIGFLL